MATVFLVISSISLRLTYFPASAPPTRETEPESELNPSRAHPLEKTVPDHETTEMSESSREAIEKPVKRTNQRATVTEEIDVDGTPSRLL